MENVKTIEVLNSLVTINNDRIKGYKTASEETEELDLKNLFEKFISTSQKCKQELAMEIESLGGKVALGTNTSGKFFHAWMRVKAALTGKDRKAILQSCGYCEKKAEETYNDVLEDELEDLNGEQQVRISAQRFLLKADFNHLKSLHKSLVTV